MPARKAFRFAPQTVYQLLTVALICAAILGWRLFTKDVSHARPIVIEGGYWAMLILGTLTAVSAVKFRRQRGFRVLPWFKVHYVGILIAVSGAVFFQLHESHQFKVLFDEFGFSGISYDMHYSREATFPARAHFLEGRLYILSHGIDKRAVFFPFLISIVHDLSGYRPENAIYLNAVLGGILLFSVYLLAVRWSQKEIGWIVQLLFIGFPLIAQCATGGGYDLANFCFMVFFALSATAYLRAAGTRGLDIFVGVTVLLAQLRYESVVFTVSCAAIVLYKWWRTRNVRLTWVSVGFVAVVALPIVINKIALSQPAYFENQPGQKFFSLSYLGDNTAHAIFYLFNITIDATNNPLFSYCGVVALLAVGVRTTKLLLRRERLDPELVILTATGAVCLGNTLLMLSCFWGNWDDPMVSRFCFPLHFLFLLCLIWAGRVVLKLWRMPRWLPFSVAIFSVAWAVPASATASATRNMIVGDEYKMFFSLLQSRKPDKTLVVGPGYIGSILYGYPSVPSELANSAPWKIARILENHHYDEIFSMQRFTIDPKTMKLGADSLGKLSDDFILETVNEERFRPDVISRVVKIVGVKPGKNLPPKTTEKHGPPFASSYDLIIDALNELP